MNVVFKKDKIIENYWGFEVYYTILKLEGIKMHLVFSLIYFVHDYIDSQVGNRIRVIQEKSI